MNTGNELLKNLDILHTAELDELRIKRNLCYENFYKMVKKWTVSDYCTPGVKAEVILDVLISDFIEDLVQYHYSVMKDKNYTATYTATLLAKEFPIRTNEKNLRNAKVDFLMYVDDEREGTLVLAELKSTDESFNNPQKNRMCKAVENHNFNSESLIDFYNKIYDKLVRNKKGDPSDRIKYQYSYDHFPESWQQKEKGMIGTSQLNLKADYLYIFLTAPKKLPEELPIEKRLVLSEYCCNEKFRRRLETEERRQLWDAVSDILKACMKK